MLLKNLRSHVTKQLDEITVFREHREGNELEIIEKGDGEKDEDRQKVAGKTLLDKITVKNLPLDNIWILENEFNHNEFSEPLINNQKGAFTAAGKKVEKTILYYHNHKLYVILIEMKRTISPRKKLIR